jgi:preprotein translocase subunit SecA
MKEIEKAVYLKTIDTLWVEHLTVMEQLRESVGLVGYGQRDPLSEYKQEAYKKYNELQNAISDIVVSMLFKIEIQPQIENKNMSKNLVYSNNNKNNSTKNFSDSNQSNNTNKPFAQKVGRNDPCPCGSGKKYKKCCGR